MSSATSPAGAAGDRAKTHNRSKEHPPRSVFLASLKNHALAGAAAFCILILIELVDCNIKLTPVVQSLSERLVFSAYLSLSLLAGLIIGLAVGVVVQVASSLARAIARVLAPGRLPGLTVRLVAGLMVVALAGIVLNQQPRVHRYIIGLFREAEKIDFLRSTLLNHERSSSYLLAMAMFFVCWLVWMLARLSRDWNRLIRAAWLVLLAGLIAFAYYVDSRVQVQLYEQSLHASLYLISAVAAMALVASLLPGSRLAARWSATRQAGKRVIGLAAAGLLVGLVAFTFFDFGKNQNLKTQIFYRTTQAKQNFRLIQWALDFDRDGYSALLDGGDADDRRPDINPGRLEVIGDGIDNNCIAGDLSQQVVDEWRAEHAALHPAPDPSAARYNILYVFIDAVRADHLSSYGYERRTTPNLDKLAARSHVFENAFTPSPRTADAVPKFMQSSYWDAHLESWTEVLTRSGYNTMLFPGRRSWERYKKWMRVAPKAQGKDLKENIDVVIETLSRTPPDRPFCAYVYVPDPHQPYIEHDEFFYDSSKPDLYDGELAYTDHHLGRLFDWMEKTGRFDDTLVVVMSDHGESLGERGVYLHATQLYNEQTHVPVIFHVPSQPPRRIRDYVSTIDLGTTILSAVGIESPKEYVGVSLLPLMRGETFVRPPIYGEQTGQEISAFVRLDQQVHPDSKKYMVITRDGFKLIFNRDVNSFELFDLTNDPKERRNLFDREPAKAGELKKLLGRFVDIVTACRPWDADEGRYSRAGGDDGDRVEQ